MEFMNRGAAQPAGQARVAHNGVGAAPAGGGKRGGNWKDSPMWLRTVWVALLFLVAAVVAALAILFYVSGPKESEQVDKNKQQAVFLTNGQVYFGKIKSVNSKYVDLRGIYYLNVNQQVQPNQGQQSQSSISLVKLGCELHGPVDQMLVNRDQVTFWENLKDDGQVAKAIAEWVKQNPDGQKCQTTTTNTTNTNSKP